MPVSTRTEREIGEGIDVGLLLLGALAVYAVVKGGASPFASPGGSGAQGAVMPTVTFSSGPTGTTSVTASGPATPLASLVTRIANPGKVDATYTVSAPIVPVSGTGYTGARWFSRYGGLPQGVASVKVTAPAQGYVDISWGTNWSGNPGIYRSQVVVGLAGQTQTFPGPQFTVTLLTPATLDVLTTGGWQGTVQIQQGQTVRPPELYTQLTNKGQVSGTWAVQVPIVGGASGLRWYLDTRGALPPGVQSSDVAGSGEANSGAIVTLAAGASVTIPWTTTWTGNAGSYQDMPTATPQ